MEKLRVNGNEYHQWFDSFEELALELPKMMERVPGNQRILSISREWIRDVNWLGHLGGARQHLQYIMSGWPQYAEAVRDAAKTIEATLDLSTVTAMTMDVRRRKRMRRESGDMLHITRVWNGDLEHAWDRPERVPRRAPSQRYATVFIDITAASYRKAKDGVWRAACAMKLNDLFTAVGISTEVWIGESSREAYPGNEREAYHSWRAVCAKNFMQPLNEDRLAALSSVGTMRTLSFEMMAASPYRIDTSFGYPLNAGLPINLRERQERGERVIRIGECWSVYDAHKEFAAVAAALANKEVEDVA
jgi:hypothetical protein